MADDEEKLNAALHAMTVENVSIQSAHANIARRLARLQELMQEITGDLGQTGAQLAADSTTAAEAATKALDQARISGNAEAVAAAERAKQLALAVQDSAMNVLAYLACFRNEIARARQADPR